MNEIMSYVWLGVFIAIPVIGFIHVYNYNRKTHVGTFAKAIGRH